MIDPILCEGINDGWFLQELITRDYQKEPLLYDNKISEFLRAVQISSSYYKERYPCLILSDNGHQLMDKYFPQTIRDLFGKTNAGNTTFIVLKDNDGSPDEMLMRQYLAKTKRILAAKNLKKADISLDRNTQNLLITSTEDNSYSFTFSFIFVSGSLESEIVSRYSDKYRPNKTESKRLKGMDPHKALEYIAAVNEKFKNREEVIRTSVNENWFSDERWFQDLCVKIREISPL